MQQTLNVPSLSLFFQFNLSAPLPSLSLSFISRPPPPPTASYSLPYCLSTYLETAIYILRFFFQGESYSAKNGVSTATLGSHTGY